MRKKTIAVVSALLLFVSLCACSANPGTGSDTPTAGETDGLPTLADIEGANAYENLVSLYGSFKYACSYNGEEPTDEKYVDDAGVYHFYSDPETVTYATADSYYMYRDGAIFVYLDMGASEMPQDPAWNAYEFYSGDGEESIEKTEDGYRITFAPDEEKAQFFMDDWQEGDVFVVTEDVRENLTMSCTRQFIRRADGTEITLNETVMEPAELPEIAQQLHDHATPAEENKAVVTMHSKSGDGSETVFTVAFTKGDAVTVETYDYHIYYDAGYTEAYTAGSEDTENGFELYGYQDPYEYF